MFTFDPYGFKADLGDKRYEERRSTVNGYGADASGSASRVEEDVVSGVDGSILQRWRRFW